eukprot:115468_1
MAGIIFTALEDHGSDHVREVLNGVDDFSSLELFAGLKAMFLNELGVVPDDEGKIDYIFGVPLFRKKQEGKTCTTATKMSAALTTHVGDCIKGFLRLLKGSEVDVRAIAKLRLQTE